MLQLQTSILARSYWLYWGINLMAIVAGQSSKEYWFSRQVGRLDLRSYDMGQVESVAFVDEQQLMIVSEPGARFLVRLKRRTPEAQPR